MIDSTNPIPSTAAIPLESSIRSERFRGGVPVTLKDGQNWYFPIPHVEYKPRLGPGGSSFSGLTPVTDLGDEFDGAMDRLDGGAESDAPFIVKIFEVAIAMLRSNYDITNDVLGQIISFKPSDPANEATWKLILATARGEVEEEKKEHGIGI